MRIIKIILAVLGLLFSFERSAAQTVAGIWEGNFRSGDWSLNPEKLVVEIFIYKDSLISGTSHLYYAGNLYEHYKIRGFFHKKDSTMLFSEVSTIAVELGDRGNCLGTYFTTLSIIGNKMHQLGGWRANRAFCTPSSEVYLDKIIPPPPVKKLPPPVVVKPSAPKPAVKNNKPEIAKVQVKPRVIAKAPEAPVKTQPVIPAPVPKKITPIQPPEPEIFVKRETDVQALLEIPFAEKDSIEVKVYDNGTIDGDSVSVYEGTTLRINKKLITAKPLIFYISLNKDAPLKNIRLVAESLGSIPPCTALMIVTTKKKRYEVRLSSNFNKNAAVTLFLKE